MLSLLCAAVATTGVGGGVGLLFLNSTHAAGAVLRGMMRQLVERRQQQQQQLKKRSLLLSPAPAVTKGCQRQHGRGQPASLLGLLREQLLLVRGVGGLCAPGQLQRMPL